MIQCVGSYSQQHPPHHEPLKNVSNAKKEKKKSCRTYEHRHMVQDVIRGVRHTYVLPGLVAKAVVARAEEVLLDLLCRLVDLRLG